MLANAAKNSSLVSIFKKRIFCIGRIGQDMDIIRNAVLFVFVISSIAILAIVLVIVSFSNKSIYIGSGLQTVSFQKENLSAIMEHNKLDYFFKNSEKLTIDSQQVNSKNNNFTILWQNSITTPTLNGKIYKGPTEYIFLRKKDKQFSVPGPLTLTNSDKNYIKTLELHGNLDKEVISDLFFEAMEEDKFISGDDLYYDIQRNYFKISNHAYLYQINDNTKYEVKSQQMEVFNLQNIAELSNNVVFTDNEETLYCDFARLFFDNQHKITDIFFRGHIVINQADNQITANYGFFDKQRHMMLLYNQVVLTSTNGNSANEFYFYDTDTKTGFSFNENTKNRTIDKTIIYNMLHKISHNLPKQHRKRIMTVIRGNKKHQLRRSNNKGENYNLDRDKRVIINIMEK